ncbi:MAG: GNAT family N-acetyltransferase [Pseudohongiellaceae bacterium]
MAAHPLESSTMIPEIDNTSSFALAEIAALFEQSFDSPFDGLLWNWKYGEGRGRATVARYQGELIAHYGGMPRDISYFGEHHKAIQIGDVMVLPQYRTHYGKGSVFFTVASSFLERQIGYTVDHLLGFGFPDRKTMQLATRLGLYKPTDELVELRYPVDLPPHASVPYELSHPDVSDPAFHKSVDRLWQLFREEMQQAVVGLRDWNYLQYRYLQHPADCYRIHGLKKPGSDDIAGVVVLRRHEENYLVMDIVGSRSEFANILRSTIHYLSLMGDNPGLKCWITSHWQQAMLIEGAGIHGLNIAIPCNSWTPGPEADILSGAWWLTAGDTDFL